MNQLTLFDLPAPQAAPAAPRQPRAPSNTAPAPAAAPAARTARQAAPASVAPTRAEKEAAAEAALASERAALLARCVERPAPPPPAEQISALAALGVDYLGSYYWPAGGRVVGDVWVPSEALAAHHVVEGRFRPARGRMVLVKTDAGVPALIAALDLPDDLLAAGCVRGEGAYSHHIHDRADGGVGVTWAHPTIEQNIAAAREGLAVRAQLAEAEAQRQAALAAKATKKRRAS